MTFDIAEVFSAKWTSVWQMPQYFTWGRLDLKKFQKFCILQIFPKKFQNSTFYKLFRKKVSKAWYFAKLWIIGDIFPSEESMLWTNTKYASLIHSYFSIVCILFALHTSNWTSSSPGRFLCIWNFEKFPSLESLPHASVLYILLWGLLANEMTFAISSGWKWQQTTMGYSLFNATHIHTMAIKCFKPSVHKGGEQMYTKELPLSHHTKFSLFHLNCICVFVFVYLDVRHLARSTPRSSPYLTAWSFHYFINQMYWCVLCMHQGMSCNKIANLRGCRRHSLEKYSFG